MNLKLAEISDGAHEVGIHQSQNRCREWAEYYEEGHRLCRVNYQDKTLIRYMADKPITTGRVLVLKFEPAYFVEIWSGLDSELGSAYVRVGEQVFYGGKVNGWKLLKTDNIPRCDFKSASSEAMRTLKLFHV